MWEKIIYFEFEIFDRFRGFDIEGDVVFRGFFIFYIYFDVVKIMVNISIFCKIKSYDFFSYFIKLFCVEIIIKKF